MRYIKLGVGLFSRENILPLPGIEHRSPVLTPTALSQLQNNKEEYNRDNNLKKGKTGGKKQYKKVA